MKEFIYSNEIAMLKFYGIIIRLNNVMIDEKAAIFVVTKRTCNKKDEETWIFQSFKDAQTKFKDIISNIKTSWGSEIADNI